jgi:hypothetical protein
MGVKVRRCLMVAGIGMLLVSAAVSAAAGSNKVDPVSHHSSSPRSSAIRLRTRGWP